MFNNTAVVALALAASHAVAQTDARPGPAVPAGPGRPVEYDSAFQRYRPFVDPELSRWREVNDEMGRLNGHAGHLPGSVPPRSSSPGAAARPPGHAGHGGVK